MYVFHDLLIIIFFNIIIEKLLPEISQPQFQESGFQIEIEKSHNLKEKKSVSANKKPKKKRNSIQVASEIIRAVCM